MWHELLRGCSDESRRFRFGYGFRQTTHEMAARYCYIDYDREIAIVAEVREESDRRLIGVGRLVSDADHETAEYAILVGDAWQGRGLGGVLTDYCLEVAQSWGVRRVIAQTSKDNVRMLQIFRDRQFETTGRNEDVVFVSKGVKEKMLVAS
jgi:acetyltransferase